MSNDATAPQQRKIGVWLIQWGMADGYRETCGEDGPYTERFQFLLVQATSKRGEVYAMLMNEGMTVEAAARYCLALPNNFNPGDDDNWCFDRNVYGSEAYQANYEEEECSRMDAAERRSHGY